MYTPLAQKQTEARKTEARKTEARKTASSPDTRCFGFSGAHSHHYTFEVHMKHNPIISRLAVVSRLSVVRLGLVCLVSALLTGYSALAEDQSPADIASDAVPRQWLMMISADCTTLPTALAAPADQWKTVVVPEYVYANNDSQNLWYHCRITTPELTTTQRSFLCFDGVKFAATVWLKPADDAVSSTTLPAEENANAFVKVHDYAGGSEPFEIDITEQTRAGGVFDLIVYVRGVASILCKPSPDYSGLKPGSRAVDQLQDAILWPIGSQGMAKIGIWEPVRLVVRDSVQFDDLFIQTSFRNKTIRIDGILKNLTDKPMIVRLESIIESIEDKSTQDTSTKDTAKTGSEALPQSVASQSALPQSVTPQLPVETISLPASGTASFSIVQNWPNPRVWSIRDPHLYNLTFQLQTTSPDRALPPYQQRFGFREFWTDGDLFYLNGIPMHALATAKHPGSQIQGDLSRESALAMYQAVRGANCNFIRLHANLWPGHWTEVADETGMPLILETGFFCWQQSYALTDPQFWTNFDVHVRALQKRYRNNPSFCCLSLENEILHCGALYRYPDCEKRLAEAGVKAKQFDLTRPISFDGDLDPKVSPDDPTGVADVVNPHYPMDFCGTFKGNEDTNWPDDAWWIDRGKVVACYPRQFWQWDRKKPLYFGEFLHIQHAPIVDAFTLVLGDYTYEASHNLTMGRAKAKAWSMQIPAYRAAGVTGMCPWTLTEPGVAPVVNGHDNPRYDAAKAAYEPVIAIMKPTNFSFYDGDKKTLEFWLINDTDVERDLNLTVETGNNLTAKIGNNLAAKTGNNLTGAVVFPAEKRGSVQPDTVGKLDTVDTVQKLPTVRLKPAERKQVFLDLDTSKMVQNNTKSDCFDDANLYDVRVTLEHKATDDQATGTSVDWTKTGRVLPDGTDAYFQKQGSSQYIFSLRKGYRNSTPMLSESDIKALGSRIGVVGEIGPAMERLVAPGGPLGKTTVLKFDPTVETLSTAIQAKVEFMIIGKDVLKSIVPEKPVLSVRGYGSFLEQLAQFKKVLVLEQDEYPSGVLPVELAGQTISSPKNNQYTKVFSCRKPFFIPAQGCWKYLEQMGGPKGLVYTPLLMVDNLVLSQYPVVDQGDVNPYVFERIPGSLRKSCDSDCRLFVFDSTGAIQKTLNRIGAQFTEIKEAKLAAQSEQQSGVRIVLVNADSEGEYTPQPNERVVLCGLTPKNQPKWSALLPAGLTLTPATQAIELTPWHESIANNRTDSFKRCLFQGPAADLYWYGQREPGLSSRIRTPRQKAADWAVVPFVADEGQTKELPLISFKKFKPNHEKARFYYDSLYSGVAVELTTTLEAGPEVDSPHFYLEIDGHGHELFGVNVQLNVYIDGKHQGLVELENQYSKKRCPVTIEQFPCELKLAYVNDLWDPETRIDRNLWFRSAQLIQARPLPDFASTTLPAVNAFVKSTSDDSINAYGTIIDTVKWFRPEFPTPCADRYITNWLQDQFHIPFKSQLSGLLIPGASFELKTSLGGKDKYQSGTAHLGTNGTLTRTIDFGETGHYTFTLRADGTQVQGIYPHVSLRIDGKTVGEFQLVQQERDSLTVNVDVTAGKHKVELQFDNDKYIPSTEPGVPNQDRNITIESLQIK